MLARIKKCPVSLNSEEKENQSQHFYFFEPVKSLFYVHIS